MRSRRKPTTVSRFPGKYEVIWDTVFRIPKGKIATYGEVAELAGLPGQARLVGYALHNLPPGSRIPWHRVINAEGKISLSDLDGLRDLQRKLLKKEGVIFVKERASFARHGWVQWLQRQGRL